MGNCQAIDNAALAIQHPNGKVDKLFSPVSAAQIMKLHPGHYVALLLTTTLYSSSAAATTKHAATPNTNTNTPLRVTRIKLLRPTDTLVLGHVYRLVTSQEVMKGLCAKKQAKLQQQNMPQKQSADFEALVRVKQERQRSSRNNTQSRGWQPALNSISEAST